MKKFDIKDVFSWSNAEDAKQYIGKQGYFADNLNDLQECVSNNNFKTLFSLDLDPETDVDSIFSITESDYYYALFLPEEKVKEVEEKKYRPFKNVAEFKKYIYGDYCFSCIEQIIKIENINTSEIYELMIVGAFVNGLVLPLYGALTMDQLFNKFKLKINDQFLPFGVEE